MKRMGSNGHTQFPYVAYLRAFDQIYRKLQHGIMFAGSTIQTAVLALWNRGVRFAPRVYKSCFNTLFQDQFNTYFLHGIQTMGVRNAILGDSFKILIICRFWSTENLKNHTKLLTKRWKFFTIIARKTLENINGEAFLHIFNYLC